MTKERDAARRDLLKAQTDHMVALALGDPAFLAGARAQLERAAIALGKVERG